MSSFKQLIGQKPLVGLAPMDGITDEPFRLVQVGISRPDFIFTEFVSAEGITRGGVKLYDQLLYSPRERPIIAQLFGKDPESFYKAAVILSYLDFDGIDLNMGCPAKTVVQNGSGAALIQNQDLALELIRSVKAGVDDYFKEKINITNLSLKEKTLKIIQRNKKYSGPLKLPKTQPTISVKTRIGINQSIVDQWITKLISQKLDFITIHGRTLSQGYSGLADWDEISKSAILALGTQTAIFGNGDIKSRAQGLKYCHKYGVAAAMIGRSSMGNPWLFSDRTPSPKEKFDTALLHAQIYNRIFPDRRFEPLRKNILSYASGLTNAKQLRSQIIRLNTVSDLLALEEAFLG